MFKRRIALATLAAAAVAATTPIAQAQPALDKTVKVVVGFPAGGASDAVARLLADQLRGSYAPTVLVDNKPGGAGRLGVQAVKSGPADGSQILVTPLSVLTIYPHSYKKPGFDTLADFAPVGSVARVPFALSVSSAVPANVKTVGDYLSWAKANPKDASYGSAAAGAAPHFVGAMLSRATGVPLSHVPFKGGAPLVTDLLGGQIQSGMNVLTDVVQHAQGGKLRVLGVSSAKRSRFLPNVPTFAESGVSGMVAEDYFAVFVPAKTPPEVVAKLNAAIRTALKAKPMIDGLEKLSFELGGESVAEFTQIVASELDRWGPVVKASGFSSED